MSEVVLLKIPEPVSHNRRELFLGGWNTVGMFHWLLSKKLSEHFTPIGEMTSTGYGRDSPSNRAKAKHNVPVLRRYAADHDELLLTSKDALRRINGVKIANLADERDRQMAKALLLKLEASGEFTEAECTRLRHLLFLEPPSSLNFRETGSGGPSEG